MSTSAHADVLTSSLLVIQNGADILHLVPASTASSYAATVAASIWNTAMASGDYLLGSVGTSRTLTAAVKTANATGNAASGVPLEWRFCASGTSRVLWSTGEISGLPLVSGASYRSPALVYTANQPTAG